MPSNATLAGRLREAFADPLAEGSLTLAEVDAVKQPLGELPECTADFHVVANLPYAISSPWLEALLSTGNLPARMVLMLQKETSNRYLAPHGSKSFGALTIFLASAYEPTGSHPVSRNCFHPVPAVDSVLLRLDRLPDPFLFSPECRNLIRRLFTRRRKQIGTLAKTEDIPQRTTLEDWMIRENLSPSLRPEQIPPQSWISLATNQN